MHSLFLYGSLMKGFHNNYLLRGAPLIQIARTKPWFTLVSLGSYPGLERGGITSVAGEIYWVTDPILATLDKLEGHPTWYRREIVMLEDNLEAVGYIYLNQSKRKHPIVDGGDWKIMDHLKVPEDSPKE